MTREIIVKKCDTCKKKVEFESARIGGSYFENWYEVKISKSNGCDINKDFCSDECLRKFTDEEESDS